MSKSILLSQNMKSATQSETYVDLGDDVLNVLWPVVRESASTYPKMWRIVEDMYGDYQLESPDLPALCTEVEQLKEQFIHGTQAERHQPIVIWLEVLRTLSTVGKQLNLAMIGIAD
jgi:hypothetical protein